MLEAMAYVHVQMMKDPGGETFREQMMKGRTMKLADKEILAQIPFYNLETEEMHFPLRPLHNVVFIWALLKYDEKLYNTSIELPESVKTETLSDLGVLLAHGPGYWDREKQNKFHPTSPLAPGTLVVYDRNVPWRTVAVDGQGIGHEVIMCDYSDVSCVCE